MEDGDQKTKLQLAAAAQLFKNRQFAQCKKALSEIKGTHLSIELNSLLCEWGQFPQRIGAVLKKIMDILVAVNIKLYQDRPQGHPNGKKNNAKTPRIQHEFYFWNIIVLAQLLPNPEIAQLVASEALHFTDSLRTETSLMLLHQLLNAMESGGRLASCIALIERQNRLMGRVKKLTVVEQAYRFMNQVVFCRVLLKLGMIEGGRIMYMMKFNQAEEQGKEGQQLNEVAGIPIRIHQQLLHAEIEFQAKNYPQTLKILGDILPQVDGLGKNKDIVKNIIDHNVALVLLNRSQVAPAQLLLTKTLGFFGAREGDSGSERARLASRCRENILLSVVAGGRRCGEGLELLRQCQDSYTYKINYRKAQLCLGHYHELLQNPGKVVTYKDIHDFYETVYYYPNMPYFQQKGKNKNPNYTNGKFSYRRYVLAPWQRQFTSSNQPRVQGSQKDEGVQKKGSKELREGKDPSRQKRNEKGSSKNKKVGKKEQELKEDVVIQQLPKGRGDSYSSRLVQVLTMAEWYLKQALVVLQKQKSIIVNLQQQQKGLTEQVNEKLYSEYIAYKSNIYSLLCYLYLCRKEWSKTIHYAEQYQSFQKQYQLHSKNPSQQRIYYSVLTYKTEAYCELGRLQRAYDTLQDILNAIDYSETAVIGCRNTASQQRGQAYFERASQCNNFGFNLSVLHSRDNKIPEAYNSIQKLLQQMRVIPSNPQANLPLSLIELLMHYNLRTSNPQSALQMIKRRRILNLPGVIGHYQPILNVTK